ncbi:LLM class flavin-dependent oxidoreductase [Paenibacillus sp. FSL W7-1287]|uniref:LLM class flavin-dependent oxidoreductase n=1 Tax=Paenibacillus sp. FSL W7-1287 TaxID=2954538 RepID=UPI0030FA8E0D
MRKQPFQFGIYTLADLGKDPHTGVQITPHERARQIVELAKMADQLGLDVFGLGEHHRLDYAVSSTAVTLGAIAQSTSNIRLTSATTIISTVDPVRLYEDYATLDLLSNGRAEIIAGRGAFFESFPLFGFDPEDYDALFEENTELFLQLNKHEKLTWTGQFRPALHNVEIAPRPYQSEIPLWIGVGGSISSAERAARYGHGMAIAILGGNVTSYQPLVEAYHRMATKLDRPSEHRQVAVTGHTFISENAKDAREIYYPYYENYKNYVNAQLGKQQQFTREQFDQMTELQHALFVGSPSEVASKILLQYKLFGHQRFLAQLDIGGMPFDLAANSLELLATKVIPEVRRQIAQYA